MSLYNKYRPQKFEDIVGNETVVEYLQEALKKKDTPQVYLFHGPTGCGKTTLARILAKELGCEPVNMKEINTADFRGIDSAREIIRNSRFTGMGGGRRVWLIDEVHKMTNDAQNALLKLLEEPPPHSFFILATTEPHKLLNTIKGRTLQLEVKPLTEIQMSKLLKSVTTEEGSKVKKTVYEQIIQDALGHPRNALQILEKVLQVSPEKQMEIAEESARRENASIDLCRALIDKSPWKKVRGILEGLKDEDPEGIRRHVLGYSQAVLMRGENDRAAHVIEEFWEPLFNVGFAGLVYYCYSVIKG